jgi:hypothetical protein
MNRLPYDLADQRSHIGRMATIGTIVIRVISLLVKQNKSTGEVFWWLVAGREHLSFFCRKIPKCMLGGGAHTISLDTLLAWCVHLGLVRFALCGKHRSHF